MTGREDRREAATDDPACRRRDAESHGIPEAAGGAKVASSDPAVEA